MANPLLAAERPIKNRQDVVRQDFLCARWVYRAQIVHHAFGARAAGIFMRALKFEPALIDRVLLAPANRLRR